MGEKFLKRKSDNSLKAVDNVSLSQMRPRSPSFGRKRITPADPSTFSHGTDTTTTNVTSDPSMIEDGNKNITELFIYRSNMADDSSVIVEELVQPFYAVCSKTGKKLFRTVLDFRDFDAKDFSVKLCARRLMICASKSESDGSKSTTNEIRRSFNIPRDVIIDQIRCVYREHKIELEAPVLELPNVAHLFLCQQQAQPTPPLQQPILKKKQEVLLNAPFIVKTLDSGEKMEVIAEVGRVFRADDIIIKVKGQGRLIISAQREESNVHGKLSASLVREIVLPTAIQHNSIRAVFTQDGLLRVSARVKARQKTSVTSSTLSTETTITTDKSMAEND